MPTIAVRLRRDFKVVINLIHAHALIHRESREVKDGKIVASLEDYSAVRDLAAEFIAQGIGMLVPPSVREIVEAVKQIRKKTRQPVTSKQLERALNLDRSVINRRVRRAIFEGLIKNIETKNKRLKTRSGRRTFG